MSCWNRTRLLRLDVPHDADGPRDERGPYAIGPRSGLVTPTEVAVRIYPRLGREPHEYERFFAPSWLVGEPEAVRARLYYSLELTEEARERLRAAVAEVEPPRWDWFVACRTRLAARLVGEGTYRGDERPQYPMAGNHALSWRKALVVGAGHHAVRIEEGEDATPGSLRWSVEEWLVGPLSELAEWLGDPGKVGPLEVRHALRYRGAYGDTALARRDVQRALTRSTRRAR